MKVISSATIVGLAIALAAALPITTASADGRQLEGKFCTNPNAKPKPGACIQLSFDGQTAQGYTGSSDRVLTLRPGVYWLTVNDTSSVHNFSLESPDGADQDITGVQETPGLVTIKVNLTQGTWVLFCEPHRMMGMYVNIEVGGVGELDSQSHLLSFPAPGSTPANWIFTCTLHRDRSTVVLTPS